MFENILFKLCMLQIPLMLVKLQNKEIRMQVEEIEEVINKVKKTRRLKNYIEYIRFPFFKNIELNTQIDFDYPLTIFVGQNGCGKSSVLQALYGVPGNNSVGRFWFSTRIDPINEAGQRNRFIYGYTIPRTTEIVEVIKTRIRKGADPDYWEPSRPLIKDGMKKLSDYQTDDLYPEYRSKTRWNAIDKEIIYIDFRAEISAFDKYIYFGELSRSKQINSKQDYLRKQSKHLYSSIINKLKSYLYYGYEKLECNRDLDPDEVNWISYILGKKYVSGKYIEHKFFKDWGMSIIFETAHKKYSEAFAGSGEMAVASLVIKVLEAKNNTLILLDEPEVSLHPGAQKRLKLFILNQIKIKKHQVVLSTHSPSLVEGMPKEAIKVFCTNEKTGKFFVKSDVYPDEAFFHIGQQTTSKKIIIVEDRLAKSLLERVLNIMGEETESLFDVDYVPGGADAIAKYYAPTYKSNVYIIFDGDKKLKDNHYTTDDIPASEDVNLDKYILEQTGVKPIFITDSNNENQKICMQRDFLKFYEKNVFYLPRETPEEFILGNNGYTDNKDVIDYKTEFEDIAKSNLGVTSVSGDEIFHTQRTELNKVPNDCKEIVEIIDVINILKSHDL